MCARVAVSSLTNNEHRFPWRWSLSDLDAVPKNGHTVLSTFSCGGGSSMGYKLAGFTVLGNVEIDDKIEAVYVENHRPRYTYHMDIRDFNALGEYPDELMDLDVLDGSPPCSVFSTAGKRQAGWGVEKQFREGQKKQRLDDLFFDYIKTASILRPRVVISENVVGLVTGQAKGYVNEILKAFDAAGYVIQMFLLNAGEMGVPQARRRVFCIGHRKDLELPKLRIDVHEPPILFGDVRSAHGKPLDPDSMSAQLMRFARRGDGDLGDISRRVRGSHIGYTNCITDDEQIAQTVVAGGRMFRLCDRKSYSDQDFINCQTFPQDYNFAGQDVQYICGMSVPPVMMAHIASAVEEQWLSRL